MKATGEIFHANVLIFEFFSFLLLGHYASASEDHFQIAEEFYYQAKYKDAITHYLKDINTNKQEMIYYKVGVCYAKLRQPDKAIGYLKRAISLNPTNDLACLRIANIYYKRGDVESAYLHVNKAIAANSSRAESYFLLGLIFKEKRDIEEEKEMYLKAVKIDPTFYEAYNNLAWILISTGENVDKGISFARIALELSKGEDKEVYRTLSEGLSIKGEYKEAIMMLTKAKLLDPSDKNIQKEIEDVQKSKE